MAQAGATIGRVNVKVLPDTTEFKREAQNELDRIEKQLDFKLALELDTARLKASLDRVAKELNDWKKNHDPLKIGVEVNMLAGQTVGISTRLAYLTRTRTVTIVPKLDEAAMAGVVTSLAALSGARVLGDLLDNFLDIGKEFDRWAPKIGLAATALGGLSALALTSISNITALGLSIAQIATAGLALPGLFAGMAVGIGVAVVGLATMKDMVPDIFAQFSAMKDLIGKNFWAEAAAGIRELTTLYLPELGATATKVGGFFGAMAEQLSGPFKAAIPEMFKNLNDSIDISSGHASVFASIITILGQTGSEYLPRLATWLNDVSTQFNDFLEGARADGSLKDFIDSGIQGFKDLGSVIKDSFLILGDIGKAAQAGGGSTLGILAETLERIREVTSSAEFQTTLTSVFETAHAVMEKIANSSGPAVSDLFTALADTFVAIGPALGSGLGLAIGVIATALSDPAFQSGIVEIFNGLAEAIELLAPAMVPLAQAFGSLAPVITTLLTNIAPLITAAMIPLKNTIEDLVPIIIPLIENLSGGLLWAIENLGGALTPLVVAFVAFKVASATVSFVQMIAGLIALGIRMYLTIGITAIATAQIIAGWIAAAAGAVVAVIPIIGAWAAMAIGALASAASVALAWIIAFAPIALVIAAVVGLAFIIYKNWDTIKQWTITAWTAIKDFISGAVSGVINFVKNNWKMILAILAGPIGLAVKYIAEHWTEIKAAFSNGIKAAIGFVRELPGKIKGFFSDAASWLIDAGKNILRGFLNGLSAMFQPIKDKLNALTNLLPDWKGPASRDKTLLYDAGKLVIKGFVNGLESQYDAVRKSLGGLSNDVGGFAVASPNMSNLNGAIDGSMAAGGSGKVFNYYAAPGSSLGSEEDLFEAASRARMVGW